MKNPKKHVNALIVLAMVLLSPVLLLAAIVFLPCALVQNHREKQKYLASPYYQKFGPRFRPRLLQHPAYRFYNDAVEAGYEPMLVRQESNGMEYLLLENTVYVLELNMEVFQAIYYSDEHGEWRVLADGDAGPLAEAWEKCVAALEPEPSDKTPRLLLERSVVWPRGSEDEGYEEKDAGEKDLALELLPPYVKLVDSYLDILGGTK